MSNVFGDQETLQRANLRESSLTKLVKFSGIVCPEKFMELYLDSNRREEGA